MHDAHHHVRAPKPWIRWLLLLVVLLLVALLGYAAGVTSSPGPSSQTDSAGADSASTYKSVTGYLYPTLNISFEVPSTWSVEINGESGFSAAPDVLQTGDISWEQIDATLVEATEFQKQLAAAEGATQVRVADIEAWEHFVDVPRDEQTKEKLGGTTYFVPLPDSSTADSQYDLIIRQQAIGSEAFESAYDHLIETLQISE